MIAKYYLRDSDGYVVSIFEVDEAESYYVTGTVYECYMWDCDTHEPEMQDFLAHVYCKFDSCTHWYFYGSDYDPDDAIDDKDSYYHICGASCLNNHIRSMCFVWKLVAMIMNEMSVSDGKYKMDILNENYLDHETTRKLVDLILDGYAIEKVEVNEG